LTLGHEWSGVVLKTGPEVEKFKPGDRIVGDTAVSCGACFECLSGMYLQCEKMRSIGTVNALPGAFSEMIVMPERHLFKLHDNISFKHGALTEPTATGMYAVERGGVKSGDIVLVHGTGPIGLAAVQLAKLAGAGLVILSGRKDFKLEIGTKLGADIVVNVGRENLAEIVMNLTNGRGPHVIIEASGSADALLESFRLLRPSGVLSVVAFYDQKIPALDIDDFILKNAKLITVGGSPVLGITVLELMRLRRICMEPIITHVYPLEEISKAMRDMEEKNDTRVKILLEVTKP